MTTMRRPRSYVLIALVLLATLGRADPARAQSFDGAAPTPSGQTPRQLEGVGVDEQMGEIIPKGLTFRNEKGQQVRLGKFFDGETPVILTLNYHNCPMLCGIQLQGFARALNGMSFTPGEEFEVVTVDFNPREGPAWARRAKAKYLKMLKRPEKIADGWHFLTGRKAAIRKLTEAVGFHYRWFPEQKLYAHPATFIFLSGKGKITRYLNTLHPKPHTTRLALIEAGNGEVGSVVEQIYLSCAVFNPDSGSYVAIAWKFVVLVASCIAVLVVGFLGFLFYLERKGAAKRAEAGEATS